MDARLEKTRVANNSIFSEDKSIDSHSGFLSTFFSMKKHLNVTVLKICKSFLAQLVQEIPSKKIDW